MSRITIAGPYAHVSVTLEKIINAVNNYDVAFLKSLISTMTLDDNMLSILDETLPRSIIDYVLVPFIDPDDGLNNAAKYNSFTDFERFIADASIDGKSRALQNAVIMRNYIMVALLLVYDATYPHSFLACPKNNTIIPKEDRLLSDKSTPLVTAAFYGDLHMLQLLDKIDNLSNWSFEDPLMVAVAYGQFCIVDYIIARLRAENDLTVKKTLVFRTVICSIRHKRINLAKRFSCLAYLDLKSKYKILKVAAHYGWMEAIDIFVNETGELHLLSTIEREFNKYAYLTENAYLIKITVCAIKHNTIEFVTKIIQLRPHLLCSDFLQYSVVYDRLEIFKFVLDKGVKTNAEIYNIIKSKHNNENYIQLIREDMSMIDIQHITNHMSLDINSDDDHIIKAVKNRDATYVAQHIATATREIAHSALQYAVIMKDYGMTALLLCYGAEVKFHVENTTFHNVHFSQQISSVGPLCLAAANGDIAMLDLLLMHAQIEPSLLTYAITRPLIAAIANKQQNMIHHLFSMVLPNEDEDEDEDPFKIMQIRSCVAALRYKYFDFFKQNHFDSSVKYQTLKIAAIFNWPKSVELLLTEEITFKQLCKIVVHAVQHNSIEFVKRVAVCSCANSKSKCILHDLEKELIVPNLLQTAVTYDCLDLFEWFLDQGVPLDKFTHHEIDSKRNNAIFTQLIQNKFCVQSRNILA